jgi:4-amino-4-deoxy-L-arabinose transferase-like glycosyltransferase
MIRGIARGVTRLSLAVQPLPRFIVTLIALAFVIRVAAAILLHFVVFSSGASFFTRGDEVAYDITAWQQAQVWRGDLSQVEPGHRYLLNAFTYTGAAIYFVVGHHIFAVILFNCLIGAIATGLIAASAYHLFGRIAAYVSGIAVAIFPTTLLMSTLNMKDPLYLLFLSLFLWLAIRLTQTRNSWLLPPILLLMVLIGSLRLYILLMLLPLIPIALLFSLRASARRRWLLALATLGTGVLLFLVGGGGALLARQIPRLNQQRFYLSSTANSGYVPTRAPTARPAASSARPAATGDYISLAKWLPTGILYTLAAPFPWAATRAIERMVIPEMLLWYLLLALALLGVVHQRRRWRSYLVLLGYLAGIVLIFATTHGNYGVLMRQRSTMLAPFVFILSGAGASFLWAHWLQRRGRAIAAADTVPDQETPPAVQLAQEQPG